MFYEPLTSPGDSLCIPVLVLPVSQIRSKELNAFAFLGRPTFSNMSIIEKLLYAARDKLEAPVLGATELVHHCMADIQCEMVMTIKAGGMFFNQLYDRQRTEQLRDIFEKLTTPSGRFIEFVNPLGSIAFKICVVRVS